MKTANTFYWTFIDTLIHNLATIAAIVVAVCQFLIRAYNENNGNEKVRKMMQTLLAFVDTIVEHGKVYFADPAVTPAIVAQKRTKRS
jgi:Flp pilus assembly protein TadB